MKVEFGPSTGAGDAPAIEAETTVTPAQDQILAQSEAATPLTPQEAPAVRPPSALAPSGLVLGDRLPDFKDIILPRLNIVQQSGRMKDVYRPGTLVFNQNCILYVPQENDPATGNVKTPASPPVTICVLGFRETRYVEKVSGAGYVRGMIVNTEADVRSAGGTLDFKEWQLKEKSGMKYFQPLVDAVVAVEKPAGFADAENSPFVFDVSGKKYALGLWGLKATAYTEAAKKVFFTNRSIGYLTEGYPTRMFSLTTKLKPFDGGKSAWIPVCIPCCKTSPEMLAWVAKVLNQNS